MTIKSQQNNSIFWWFLSLWRVCKLGIRFRELSKIKNENSEISKYSLHKTQILFLPRYNPDFEKQIKYVLFSTEKQPFLRVESAENQKISYTS